MTWFILMAIGFTIAWVIQSRRVEDHTGDPEALPCPVCSTASPLKTLGYHVCPQCASRWLPSGSWVIRFRCRSCEAKPVHLTQDTYNPSLFSLKFACGRVGNYNHETGSKWDRKPCGHAVHEEVAKTEPWGTAEETPSPKAEVAPTKIDTDRPDWVNDDDCTSVNDYEGETEVHIG